MNLSRFATCSRYIVLFSIAGLLPVESASDWPGWGGKNGSLRAEANLKITQAEALSLELAWQRKFGSGYTAVTVAEALGVCAATHEDGDYLIAFNLENGNTVWKYRLDEVFKGRSGSDDGPISTPLIEGTTVYMVHPSGKVAAVNLSDGREIWRLDLVREHDAAYPGYGFSTSPVIVGDILVLPFNHKKPATLMGVDKRTGKRVWAAGSSSLGYQNPIVMGALDRRYIVFPANEAIYAIAPKDGRIVWEMPVEGNDSTMVAPVDEHKFLYKAGRQGQMIRVTQGDDGPKPEVLWEKAIFKNNHCQPIYFDGHLYGFDGRFLACHEAATGNLVWKSRPPGGQTIAMVDDLLLMWDAKGGVSTVKATPSGYREMGRLALSNQARIYTPPTYANGLVFMRDLSNLYAVRMTKAVNPDEPEGPTIAVEDDFTKFVRQLASASKPQPILEAFLENHPNSPVITDRGWVHFFYVGDTPDLAIQGDMAGYFPEVPMHRVENTPFFYRSYQMENNQRWQYRYKRFEETLLDPKNQNREETTRGEFNIIVRGTWSDPSFVTQAPTGPKGTLDPVEIPDPDGEDPLKMSVYTPANYQSDPNASFPLVVFAMGEQAQKRGHTVAALDQFSGKSMQPAVAVFLELPRRFWWDRFTIRFQEVMENQIMPYLESNYRLAPNPESRTFVSREWSTKNPLLYVLKYPKRFGNFALQSPLVTSTFIERELKPAMANHSSLNLYLDWGRYDAFNPSWPANIAEDTAKLAQVFRDAGHSVKTAVRPGGYGWVSWRTHTAPMLSHFLPKP